MGSGNIEGWTNERRRWAPGFSPQLLLKPVPAGFIWDDGVRTTRPACQTSVGVWEDEDGRVSMPISAALVSGTSLEAVGMEGSNIPRCDRATIPFDEGGAGDGGGGGKERGTRGGVRFLVEEL
ncbi:hypothetical protein N7533_002172 [Penicillium manginii]|uniref:uncharacterized protein n=1 Tax=Penicillium manginii TaxID=203109 RepID=UPI0025482000|nr:uncharacterized protein N7533_002172 [Penicillium manginii]KAJ5763491.1 hypothetical protein N7533_002172 [Penicillium manginii]